MTLATRRRNSSIRRVDRSVEIPVVRVFVRLLKFREDDPKTGPPFPDGRRRLRHTCKSGSNKFFFGGA